VEFQQFGDIELGRSDDLDLADENVLQGVDDAAGLFDFSTNGFSDELLDQSLEFDRGGFLGNDFDDFLADSLDLSSLSVASLLGGVRTLLGESDGENTEDVTISSLDISVGLNKSLPLADKGSQLVGGEIHTVEVGEEVTTLNIFATKLDLAETLVLILVQVTKTKFENTTLESFRSNAKTSSTSDQGLSSLTDIKDIGSLDVVPFLLGVGVNNFLLGTLSLLGETFILTNSHVCLTKLLFD